MTVSVEDMAPGEIARTLGRLDEGQKELVRAQREGQQAVMSELALMRGEFVNHREWEQQNSMHTRDVADVENQLRTVSEQVASHRDGISRLKGVMWILGGILGVVVAVVTSYIQSGRL